MRSTQKLIEKVSKVFRPSAPINDPKFFVGREIEKNLLLKSLFTPGRHTVVYGNRGVGKTSLINITTEELVKDDNYSLAWHKCSYKDSFESIFFDLLQRSNQLMEPDSKKKKTIDGMDAKLKIAILEGGGTSVLEEEESFAPKVKSVLSPNSISYAFIKIPWIFVIDEFDRLRDTNVKSLIAETMKSLADANAKTKIILSGVSSEISTLIGSHQSTLRNITTISIPRMSQANLIEIMQNGAEELNLVFSSDVMEGIVSVSDGLPYFTHLMCEQLAISALEKGYKTVENANFYFALENVLASIHDEAHQSFQRATVIQQSGFINVPEDPVSSLGFILSFPGFIRKLTLLAFSLIEPSNEEEFYRIANFIRHLSRSKSNIYLSSEYEDFDETDVVLVLSEICKLSDIVVEENSSFRFRDSFFRAYTRLMAAKEFKEFGGINCLPSG